MPCTLFKNKVSLIEKACHIQPHFFIVVNEFGN